MKRRNVAVVRARWRRAFPRWRRLAELGHALSGSIVAATIGFSTVLVIGVVLHGQASGTRHVWPQMERLP